MKKHEIAYPNTAVTGNFVPPNFPGKAIEHKPKEVQCANKKNMQPISNVELGLSALPPHLKKVSIFRGMTSPLF